jgi:CubicO group peptidase (beta-lactamase class C family)
VRAATGKTLAQYLSEKIWIPYGMEPDANWMLDKGGMEQAGCCISASLRDFGSFGVFFMEGAKIDGVSIVPDDWVTLATTTTEVAQNSKYVKDSPAEGYGFMWWIFGNSSYDAVGIFGQLIHINPALKLVIVTQSAWPKALSGIELQASFIKAVEAAVAE